MEWQSGLIPVSPDLPTPASPLAVPSRPASRPAPPRQPDGPTVPLRMPVRVYGPSQEVLVRRGLAVGKRQQGTGTIWSVIPDGETAARDYSSPPCVLKRLKPGTLGDSSGRK